jgi:hypothetical protein
MAAAAAPRSLIFTHHDHRAAVLRYEPSRSAQITIYGCRSREGVLGFEERGIEEVDPLTWGYSMRRVTGVFGTNRGFAVIK